MNSVELFAGAGGLALGISSAGFHHKAIVEWNSWACNTIRRNRERKVKQVSGWPDPHEGDVREVDFKSLQGTIQLVSGGPPCQPFSIGGKHKGYNDSRDMFPQAVRAVREIQPNAFIFENVRGLLRASFSTYLEYITLQLQYPYLAKHKDESWRGHLTRLEQHHTSSHDDSGDYCLVYQNLDAANYGVPQRRHRVIFVGFKKRLNVSWSFPQPTHSYNALLKSKWVSGDYWDEHEIAKKSRPKPPNRFLKRIEKIKGGAIPIELQRWRTVRDAIYDLPKPHKKQASIGVLNHFLHPGAKAYPGHTGSPPDLPSKALKAGVHGVPGGENMLAYPNGKVRYFSVREAARLQTIPDNYALEGPWSEAMRQLGNGVPVELSRIVASSVHSALSKQKG